MRKCFSKDKPRFMLLVNERMETAHREEVRKQAELQQFIKACEALYKKNRGRERSD